MSSSSESEKDYLGSRSASGSESDGSGSVEEKTASFLIRTTDFKQHLDTAEGDLKSNDPGDLNLKQEKKDSFHSKKKSEKASRHEKRLKKRELKTKKLLIGDFIIGEIVELNGVCDAVVRTASEIEKCLTDVANTTNEKTLTKHLLEHEKVLEKLSRYMQASKASYLEESIPIGLLRAVDRYENPYEWIKNDVINKLQKGNDDLRGSLNSINLFHKLLQKSLSMENLDFSNISEHSDSSKSRNLI